MNPPCWHIVDILYFTIYNSYYTFTLLCYYLFYIHFIPLCEFVPAAVYGTSRDLGSVTRQLSMMSARVDVTRLENQATMTSYGIHKHTHLLTASLTQCIYFMDYIHAVIVIHRAFNVESQVILKQVLTFPNLIYPTPTSSTILPL